jgi:hypothetical protein
LLETFAMETIRTSLAVTLLLAVGLSTSALADKKKKGNDAPPPPPAETGKGDLKPGQGVGRRVCLGSTGSVGNIEVTSNKTVGVATCNGELKRVFLEKGICKAQPKGAKVEYGWQFADTTGTDTVRCP